MTTVMSSAIATIATLTEEKVISAQPNSIFVLPAKLYFCFPRPEGTEQLQTPAAVSTCTPLLLPMVRLVMHQAGDGDTTSNHCLLLQKSSHFWILAAAAIQRANSSKLHV